MLVGDGLLEFGKCWPDCVREDWEALRLLLNWSRLAKERESWRDVLQQILEHTQQNAGKILLINLYRHILLLDIMKVLLVGRVRDHPELLTIRLAQCMLQVTRQDKKITSFQPAWLIRCSTPHRGQPSAIFSCLHLRIWQPATDLAAT